MIIKIENYGTIISDQESGSKIYDEINSVIEQKINCIVDFTNLKSMATYNAKQVFGQLYLKLGSSGFFEKIEIRNASDDLRLIIRLGIQSALDDNNK